MLWLPDDVDIVARASAASQCGDSGVETAETSATAPPTCRAVRQFQQGGRLVARCPFYSDVLGLLSVHAP